MYILIKASIPTGFGVIGAARASLATYLAFKESPEVRQWLSGTLCGTLYKVVCLVSDAEFEQAKTFADRVVMTESALGGREVAMGFRPRSRWPSAFKSYRVFL